MELKIKELKQILLDGGLSEEQIKTRYEELKKKIFIYQSDNGKRMAYVKIAKENNIAVQVGTPIVAPEVFPLTIDQVFTSEKTNFTISGYILNTFIFDNGNMIVAIVDNTNIIDFTIWKDAVAAFEIFLDQNNVDHQVFVKIKNLRWVDKTKWNAQYSKFSQIELAEATFPLEEAKAHTSVTAKTQKYSSKLIGMVMEADKTKLFTVFHCEKGHRFKGAEDTDVGSLQSCSTGDKNCGEAMEVMKSIVGTITMADRDGWIDINISTFQNLQSIEEEEMWLYTGKWMPEDDKQHIKIYDINPLKKNN